MVEILTFTFLILSVFSSMDQDSVDLTQGLSLLEQDKLDSALFFFDSLHDKYPENLDVLFFRAKAEANSDNSYEYFQKIISVKPDYEHAEECLKELGDYCLANEKYKDATRYYKNLINGYSDSEDIDYYLYHAGRAQMLAGENEKAKICLKRLLLEHPVSPFKLDVYLLIADIEFELSNLEKARIGYQGLLHTLGFDKKARVLYQLSTLESKAGNNKQADAYRNTLIKDYLYSIESLNASQDVGAEAYLNADETQKSKQEKNGAEKYTIQFGAFVSELNAQRCLLSLVEICKGLHIAERVRNQKKIYFVWTKSFEKKDGARKYAESLNIPKNIRYTIVKETP